MKTDQKGIVHILLIVLLLAGLGVGVYLVGVKQIFKSKASSNPPITDSFQLQDDNGANIYCSEDSVGVYLCYSDTKTVNIQVKNLDNLTQ